LEIKRREPGKSAAPLLDASLWKPLTRAFSSFRGVRGTNYEAQLRIGESRDSGSARFSTRPE
jgi:hypothetical protein